MEDLDLMSRDPEDGHPLPELVGSDTWIRLIAETADTLQKSSGVEQDMLLRLVSLGQRRGKELLSSPPPLFGLTHLPTLLAVLKGPKERILLMRRVAARFARSRGLNPEGLRIRYKLVESRSSAFHDFKETKPFEYCPALPIARNSVERTHDGSPVKTGFGVDHGESHEQTSIDLDTAQSEIEQANANQDWYFCEGSIPHCALLVNDCFLEEKRCLVRYAESAHYSDVQWAIDSNALSPVRFISVLSGVVCWDEQMEAWRPQLDAALSNGDYRTSMRALLNIARSYRGLGNCTISLQAATKRLSDWTWNTNGEESPKQAPIGDKWCLFKDNCALKHNDSSNKYLTKMLLQRLPPFSMSRWNMFALLASMESGCLDVHPESLMDVMAMATGDSIYLTASLLLDPGEFRDVDDSAIRRIRGNIGKAGIAMLIAPEDPMRKRPDQADWKVINHSKFDGKLEDSFKGTSLHLSFTDFKTAIPTDTYGFRDTEMYYMEAVVSVFDRDKWVADLDVLSALPPHIYLGRTAYPCEHCTPSDATRFEATAVDNWDEFIDKPSSLFVFRDRGNWIARLAAATISANRGDETIVIPSDYPICWECLREKFQLTDDEEKPALIC
ncbi:hypothetical protein BDY21DRAFT_40543 [Lineolata rhizophorae]|uniref:Uncharacterized protein n=1 Tax=Lineolata rhizophorae TaxID=578093 RepID=A0A6A6NYR5_9PEZI|nr:hypothetical protein BDY21DRAFT_40543 [Lineolata rhizophorae]